MNKRTWFRVGIFAAVAAIAPSFPFHATALAQGAPPAFPGAEGFGAAATGGRGGRVIYVTNLNAEGAGSLQAALDETGPRYILFKVSGLIDAAIQLTTDDLTIAGQTSPGGIIVRGFHTTEEPFCGDDPVCIATARTAENWILRHLRTRPGTTEGGLDDGLRLLHTRRAIVDHVSIANATDEGLQVSFAHDLTIQNTLLAETLGDHADRGGLLMNYSDPASGWALDRLSIHHNNWNRIVGRMPEISRESVAAAGTVMDLEISNNLLWDAGYFIDVTRETFPYGPEPSSPVYYHFNWVGNAAHVRPDFPFGMISFPDPLDQNPMTPSQTTTYWNDNRLDRYPDRRDYQLNYCCNDYPTAEVPPATAPYAQATRHAFPAITYAASSTLRDYMRANVGAFPRDPMDRRLMAPVGTGVFDPAPRETNPYGDAYLTDWPAASPPAPPLDTDADGMPDTWETAHSLDPSLQDHNGTELSVPMTGVPGYTNLECYLNELADTLVGGGGGVACGGNARELCLSGGRFAVTARWTAGAQSGDGTPVTLTADTGYFWFFAATNVEMVVKVLNACSLSGHYWVFAGGLTDVLVDMTVRDTNNGAVRTYRNPQGTAFQPIQDTSAFATCP